MKNQEKYLIFLVGEILKLPKSASKESMIDKISKHF